VLGTKAIGVVGSRKASEEDLKYAKELGEHIISQGFSVVSGGAKGIDEASMLGALENDGTCIGILADKLLQRSTSKTYRQHLVRKNLVLLSPFHPEARFNVGNAMGRNKYIYAKSDATCVIHSGRKGGTWTGAIENLNSKFTPLYVKKTKTPKQVTFF
jgi:predicted Rossmann fold nucleotide-binding protein DprA/Smf involved in DNA uptake